MSTVTNIKYKGAVSVKIHIGDKTVSLKSINSGTDYLKKSICKFLSGNYGGNPDIPQYLDLRKRVPNSNRWETYLNETIAITGKKFLYVVEDAELDIHNNWVARFNAAIPRNALKDSVSAGSEDEFRLYLYGAFDSTDISERYHDLAYIGISSDDLSRITPGTQALVEWSMQIFTNE